MPPNIQKRLKESKIMFTIFVASLFWLPSLSATTDFLKPEMVVSENPNQVTLGLIMVNIKQSKNTSTADLFKETLDALVLSLAHHSTVPILLVVVTDSETLSGEFSLSWIWWWPCLKVISVALEVFGIVIKVLWSFSWHSALCWMDVFIMWNTHNIQAQIGPAKHPNHTWCNVAVVFFQMHNFFWSKALPRLLPRVCCWRKRSRCPRLRSSLLTSKTSLKERRSF